MKKLLALILALAMLTALCACAPIPCSHVDLNTDGICDLCQEELETVCDTCVDENEDGVCDNCGEEIPCEHVDEANDGICDKCGATVERTPPVLTGVVLTSAVIEQLEAAASMELKIEVVAKDEYKNYYMWDDEAPELSEYKGEQQATITATVSRDADGNVAFKLIGEAKDYSLSDDEIVDNPEYDTSAVELYFVDNTMYLYDEDLDAYLKTSYEGAMEELGMAAETFEAMLEGVELSEEETGELLAAIGDSVIAALNIESGKGSVSIDLADDVNELLAYFAEIDTATDTLGGLLNDALALVDEELTIEALLDEVEGVAGLTISEALEAIDAWLTEEYETTLQGVYDTIVAEPRFAVLFANIYLERNPEATEDDIAAALDEVKAFKIADFITEQEMGEVVLYDFILMATGAASEDAPTCEEFFATVDSIVAMTFDQLSENMEMEFPFAEMAGVEILQLKAGYEVEFSPFFEIVKVNGSFVIEVETEADSGIEGYDYVDTTYSYQSVSYSITNIKTTAVEVTAPTEKVYEDFLSSKFEYMDDEYLTYTVYFNHSVWEDEGVEVEDFSMQMYIEMEVAGVYSQISVYATDLSLDMFNDDTITIPAESLYSDSDSFEATQDLIIVIDAENDSFVIEQWYTANIAE